MRISGFVTGIKIILNGPYNVTLNGKEGDFSRFLIFFYYGLEPSTFANKIAEHRDLNSAAKTKVRLILFLINFFLFSLTL